MLCFAYDVFLFAFLPLFFFCNYCQAEKKEKAVEEVTTMAPKLAEGDEYFAVAHIFASFNDTFVVRKCIVFL